MRRRRFAQALTLLCFSLHASAGFSAIAQEAPEKAAQQLVSLDFENVTLKQLLKIFSQQSGLNFVASSEVELKTVTVYFENVTVKDALESLMTANNLEYYQAEGSNIFVVYPANSTSKKLQTRVFFLKYMRLSTSPLDIGGQKTVFDLTRAAELASGSQGSTGSGTSSQQFPSSKSSTQRGVDQLVASLLSESGKVTLDLNTNSLIVTDTPEKLRQIAQVIEKIDVPTPQVLLEVYLMEVKKDLISDLGVEWGGTDGALATFTAGSRTTGFPFTENFLSKRFQTRNRIGDEDAPDPTQESLTLGTFSAANFTATLHMIISDNDTKILSRPRVLTLNNEAATIKLITDAAIANTATTTTAEGTAVTSANQAERTQVGIDLKMTPQINEDDSVALFLEPTVTTVAPSSFFASIFLDPTRRSIRTLVRVNNHETLVIGGLLDTSEISLKKRIPFLGKIPILGYAFRYDESDGVDRELLIFITPHIVRPGESRKQTVYAKDLAVKRMLDQFIGEEMDRSLEAVLAGPKEPVTKLSLPAERNKRIAQALNAMDPKTVKWNR